MDLNTNATSSNFTGLVAFIPPFTMANVYEVDDKMVRDIRQAVKDCMGRGLVSAAKWSLPTFLVQDRGITYR